MKFIKDKFLLVGLFSWITATSFHNFRSQLKYIKYIINELIIKFTTLALQVKVKVVALYCHYIFGVVFQSVNPQTKASF